MRYLFICLCLLSSVTGYGQIRSEVTHYGTKDGLSHDGVICITRDREGFMWFGTYDGLDRFDGHNFVIYKTRPGDSSVVHSDKIKDIVEDKAAYLWVQTFDYKVYRFEKATEAFVDPFQGYYKKFHNEQLIIDKIVADPRGGAWFVTKREGIYYVQNRPGSLPVLTYFSKDQQGDLRIKGDRVNFHRISKNGWMWVGSGGGLDALVRRDDGTYVKVKFDAASDRELSNTKFNCMAEGSRAIYFGTANGRLVIYDKVQRTFVSEQITGGVSVNDVCILAENQIYLSTSGEGLINFNPVTRQKTPIKPNDHAVYHSLFKDRSGQIWIEPDGNGVDKYNPQTGVIKSFSQKPDYPSLSRGYHLYTDVNGILWVSMRGGGFGYYDAAADKVEYFFDEPGSPFQKFSNVINALYFDPSGIMWLSGKDGGVFKIAPLANGFNYIQPAVKPRSRSENDVRAMMQDLKGRFWVCTMDGLVHVYDHKAEINVFANKSNHIGFVYSITQDSKGNVWMGTKGDGLFKATPVNSSQTSYTVSQYRNISGDKNSLSSDKVYSVIEDHKGRIWVGTFGGGLNLLVANGSSYQFRHCFNTFHNYPYPLAKMVRDICEDNDGNIWVVSGNGVLVFDGNQQVNDDYRFIIYKKIAGDPNSLATDHVQYICKDNKGQLWLGSFGGGISKIIVNNHDISNVKFKTITTTQGLPNDVVLSMVADNQNNVWIATAAGLACLDAKTETFRNYDPFEASIKTNFSEATCLKAADGTLLFGCLDGYISFKPGEIGTHHLPANMVLTNMQVSYKNVIPGVENSPLKYTVNETRSVTLNHDQNAISIDYTVLDYRDFSKISYSYKLENFDTTWHIVNDMHKAIYTNLPPGTYTFRVRGYSNDLFSNVPEKALQIIIRSPLYLTWWAYLTYLVLAAVVIWLTGNIVTTMIGLRNKVEVERQLTEVKLSFFTNISHELRTPLTLISNPLEELSETETLSEKGREYFKIINRNVARMIRFTNQLLDFRKVQSGKMQLNIVKTDLNLLVGETGAYFATAAKEKNIQYNIRIPEATVFTWIDPEKIEIIVYNLLSNAFKFSPDGKNLTLSLSESDGGEWIKIAVQDEGKGVAPEQLETIFELYHEDQSANDKHLKGTGIGLALARGLAQSHKGNLSAHLNSTGGMTFILELRQGCDHFSLEELGEAAQFVATGVLNEEQVQVPEVITETATDTSRPTVLVVEDDPDLRNFLENKLNNYYQVVTATNGFEGLNMAKSSYPDIVISDVMMPEMDGIQMLDAIKHDHNVSHIPVILLTAKSSVESRINGLKYGADFYLTKPFNNALLLAAIGNLLHSRKKLFERFTADQPDKTFNWGKESDLPVMTSKDETFLEDVIKIVEQKLGDQDFNIDDVASEIGMSRTTFFRKLKSLTSLSPVEFMRELRLKRSKQILDTGKYTISEAGYMAGFNSLAYFSTCFRDKYQISPSAYLKNKKSVG
ncbi:two-component regulator propeller domain-containing protein [Mucilaginibacter sp. AW1-3]